jgi:penicillin-binding protein 1A
MVGMMKRVIEAGTGQRGAIGRPAAGKTGTSQRWRDAWFIGFTPDWIAGVWVGNDDNRPMNRVVGGDLPAQIWRRFMLQAHRGLPVRDFPALVPPEEAGRAMLEEARAAFYSTLAAEFGREAGAPEPPPPPVEDRMEDAPPEEGY